MKILEIRKNKVFLWCFAIVICYLAASMGVNKVVNPLYYFNNSEQIQLEMSEVQDEITINTSDLENGYLNIVISEMNIFMQKMDVEVHRKESVENIDIELSEGVNSYHLSNFGDAIAIRKSDLEGANIVISDIYWTEQKQVDMLGMLKVFFSLLFGVLFYSLMKWIRVRFTK